MIRRKGKTQPSTLPNQPPDPAAIRQELLHARRKTRSNIERTIKSKVLPHVNAALHSQKNVSYDVGELDLAVTGSRSGVYVLEDWGTHEWAVVLLKELRAEPYQGYNVVLWGGTSDGRRREKLDKQNVAVSLRKFRKKYPHGSLIIQIFP